MICGTYKHVGRCTWSVECTVRLCKAQGRLANCKVRMFCYFKTSHQESSCVCMYSAAHVSVLSFSLLKYMQAIHSILYDPDVSCQRRNMLPQTFVAILVLAVRCYCRPCEVCKAETDQSSRAAIGTDTPSNQQTPYTRSNVRKRVPQVVKKYPHFTESEFSLPLSQEPAT
jgi:hypothetical protein